MPSVRARSAAKASAAGVEPATAQPAPANAARPLEPGAKVWRGCIPNAVEGASVRSGVAPLV